MTALKRPSTQKEINAFRRLALMEGVLDSIAIHGLNGTTVKTISESSGGSRGLVNHYFKNKDELIAAAYRHLADQWEARVTTFIRESGKSAEIRLRAYATACFHPDVLSPKWLAAYLAFMNEPQRAPMLHDVKRQVNAHYRGVVTRLFARAAEELSHKFDTDVAALSLLALIDGLWLQLSIDPSNVDPKFAESACHKFISQTLAK